MRAGTILGWGWISCTLASPLANPALCAIYFDFRHTLHSSLHFGSVSKDGTVEQIADLGRRFDPQGQVKIREDGSKFAMLTLDNATIPDKFGCCDKTSVMDVDVTTGKFSVASLHRKLGPVKGANCGEWGCGFLEFGSFNSKSNSVMGWVEQLLPPPPPAPMPALLSSTSKAALNNDGMGLGFVDFDLGTSEATLVRPFTIPNNNTAPTGMASGVSTFDDPGKMWFACLPNRSEEAEGLCSVPTANSRDNAPISAFMSPISATMTTTSLQYSKALKRLVVLSQAYPATTRTSTKVYSVNPAQPESHWEEVVDLGPSWSSSHQTVLSADGRYLTANLPTGSNQDHPEMSMVLVDLVGKTHQSVVMKNPVNLTMLVALPC